MQRIVDEGAGILIYEQQEGRGIGLMAKLRAYELQDKGLDTVEANLELGYKADCRVFEVPAKALKLLGVHAVRLITNNPEKIAALEEQASRSWSASPPKCSPHLRLQSVTLKPSRRGWAIFSLRLRRSSCLARSLHHLCSRHHLSDVPLRVFGNVHQHPPSVVGNRLRPTTRSASRSVPMKSRTR